MLIAIGGPSNAGKSDLAKKISGIFGNNNIPVLCQDDYVFPKDQLPKIDNHIDWEHPDTIDNNTFLNKINQTLRTNTTVVVEGFMIYHWPDITKLFDRKIFIQLDEKTFRKRKQKDLRWGKEPDWYIDHIWAKHLEFGRAPDNEKFLFLDGTLPWPINDIKHFLDC